MQLTASSSAQCCATERRQCVKPHAQQLARPRLTAVVRVSGSGLVPCTASSKVSCPLPAATRSTGRSRAVSVRVSASSQQVYDTVIVGAGISGLVTAQALSTRHSSTVPSFLVTEARERVGGNITTVSDDSYLWEEGPNSFQPSDSVLQMAVRGRRHCC